MFAAPGRCKVAKGARFLYICSLVVLVCAGFLFIEASKQARVVGIIENLKSKTILFYSSNPQRSYLGSNMTGSMDMLCIEGVSHLKTDGLKSECLKIEKGDADPYTQSGTILKNRIKNSNDYVLIDISRNQERHGSEYDIEGKKCCPIVIKLSRKSQSYDDSLLFAGRIKTVIDEKYKTLPFQIETVDDGKDYNQSLGCIGLLLEIGDSANTYEEASASLKLFCKAVTEANNLDR